MVSKSFLSYFQVIRTKLIATLSQNFYRNYFGNALIMFYFLLSILSFPSSLTHSRFTTQTHTEEDYDAFCLAYMFTYRDFEMGTLGLAWTGDLKNAGGVCEKNGVRLTKNLLQFMI